MAKPTSKLRKEVEHVYTLSDQLQVQLQVLEQIQGGIRVKVTQASPSPEGDIEALALLVMIEASKSARDDLRAIMDQMKAINRRKHAVCEMLGKPKRSPRNEYDLETTFQLMATLYARQLEAGALDTMRGDLDSTSELGETQSLRLQMAMDRLSKMMSTLSNLLKKISDTANQVVQNLK